MMKYMSLMLMLLFFLCSMQSQEFIVDPSLNKVRLVTSGDGMIEINKIPFSSSPYTPEHYGMSFHDEEGEEFLIMNERDGIVLTRFEENNRNIISKNGMTIYSGGEPPVQEKIAYNITANQGFAAYDSDGNMTVQIRGDVGGDGRVSTNELEITGGSDLSENFNVAESTDHVLPGMLVSIADLEGELVITTNLRDKRVVGVISGANGIETGMMMGQKGSIADGDYPVALTGRTYVLANTENGPISPGDFITSSSTAGYGMKVKKIKKCQGAIIGKAMTSLPSGKGYVLVLVNLQ